MNREESPFPGIPTCRDMVMAWRSSKESVGRNSRDSGGLGPTSDPSGWKSRIFPMTHFCVTCLDWKSGKQKWFSAGGQLSNASS